MLIIFLANNSIYSTFSFIAGSGYYCCSKWRNLPEALILLFQQIYFYIAYCENTQQCVIFFICKSHFLCFHALNVILGHQYFCLDTCTFMFSIERCETHIVKPAQKCLFVKLILFLWWQWPCLVTFLSILKRIPHKRFSDILPRMCHVILLYFFLSGLMSHH